MSHVDHDQVKRCKQIIVQLGAMSVADLRTTKSAVESMEPAEGGNQRVILSAIRAFLEVGDNAARRLSLTKELLGKLEASS